MDEKSQRSVRPVYGQEFVGALGKELKALKPKASARMSARQVVEALRDDFVEAVTRKNYSFEDLCQLLGDKGLAMRPATLREYLGPIGREKSGTCEGTVSSSRKESKPIQTAPKSDRSRGDVSSSERREQQHAGFEEEV
jgi:hypothetical protein